MRKSFFFLGAAAALLLIVAGMSGVFREKIEPGRADVRHRLGSGLPSERVHRILETEYSEVPGSLRAVDRTDVAARIMARIESIAVQAGDRVEQGDVLAVLDDRELKAALDQAAQSVAAARSDFRNAAADLDRFEELHASGAVSRSDLDQARNRHEVAEARVEGATHAETAAAAALSHATITAPIAGVIVDRLAQPGDTAAPGRPLLSIYNPGAFRMEAAAPESLGAKLQPGDMLGVRLDALDLDTRGAVELIVPQASAASRTVLVKVRLPATEGMVEGMFGRLFVPAMERARVCVPLSAVRETGQLSFVDVVGPENRLERRYVKLGDHSEYGRIEALSGLDGGEEVILYGPAPPAFPDVLPDGRKVSP